MEKIVSVKEPEDTKSRYAMWRVVFEDEEGQQYPADMHRERYELILARNALEAKGINPEDLNMFEKAVRDDMNRSRIENDNE